MKLVRQPEKSNCCGQACVAMLAGITLEESMDVFGTRGTTSTKDVVNALRELGISCGNELVRIKKKEKAPTCMVVLHFADVKFTHWAVYHHGLYFDPACGILAEYQEGIRETSFLPVYAYDEQADGNRFMMTAKGFWRVETMPYIAEYIFEKAWARFEQFLKTSPDAVINQMAGKI